MEGKDKKSNKGKLVKNWSKPLPRKSYKEAPNSREGGSGIYILYKDEAVYYVGLTTRSIRGRLRKHTRDRHKNNWDKFSFYQIPKRQYVKDIESILLGTYKTPGNIQGGRLKKKREVIVSFE